MPVRSKRACFFTERGKPRSTRRYAGKQLPQNSSCSLGHKTQEYPVFKFFEVGLDTGIVKKYFTFAEPK